MHSPHPMYQNPILFGCSSRLYHMEMIKISDGLIQDSNIPRRNRVATRDP